MFVSVHEKVPHGKHFVDVEEVRQKTAEALKGINIEEFKHCFEQWRKRLERYTALNGEDFDSERGSTN